jgi:hypothetical protein
MFPPHLPPPTSNIARHRQWERLKIILVSTLFGLISGLSGAAILLGWIWPLTSGTEGFFYTRTSSPKDQLQARAQLKIADEIFSVYSKATTIGKGKYFSKNDKIGDGVMSVTSGWVIMYYPQFNNRASDWIAVAENGSLYKVSRTLFDKRTGLLYAKLEALVAKPGVTDEQFKVVTFNNGLNQYDEVFVLQEGRWLSSMVVGPSQSSEDSHLDTAAPPTYNLNDSFVDGSVVIDGQGNMIGFIRDRAIVMSMVNENYFLNGIEDKKQILYPSLGVEGWFSDEKIIVVNEEKISGFVVTKVDGNKQLFQKGDIILQVNGRPADRTNMWYTINNQKVRVSIWRSGSTIEAQAAVLEL